MADQLKVRMMPRFGNSADLTPLLCDADGNALPGQMAVKIETAVDDHAVVTVTFSAVKFIAG